MKPRTRKENYLAKIAKDPDAVEMTPKTRTEHYLNEIAENGGGPFIVTLTPTAADMGGTMDKTVGEIYEAWTAGKKIVFRASLGSSTIEIDCTARYFESGIPFPSFNADFFDGTNGRIILIYTGATAEEGADDVMYYTRLYTLTPAT